MIQVEMIEKKDSREHVVIGTRYGMCDRKNTLAVV